MATYTGLDKRLAYLFANGGGGGGECKVISGYYHNGDFYEDQSYTQIITGSEDSLYIDLDTTTLYLFDGTDYVEVQGGTVSDGTVGFRDSVVINSGASITYDWSDVGLDKWGSYLISMTGENASGTGYTGILARTAYIASSWAHSGLYSIRSSNISVSVNDTTEQITFTNNSSYDIGFIIEVLPLHPKIEIPKHTYSTTEQVVGTWIDGKPIYEKTIQFNSGDLPNANSSVNISHGISDFGELISAEGFVNDGTSFRPLSNARVRSSEYAIGYVVFSDRVYIESAIDLRTYIGFITLRYTKSTT